MTKSLEILGTTIKLLCNSGVVVTLKANPLYQYYVIQESDGKTTEVKQWPECAVISTRDAKGQKTGVCVIYMIPNTAVYSKMSQLSAMLNPEITHKQYKR